MLATDTQKNSRPERSALLKQMQGRTILSDMVMAVVKCKEYYRYNNNVTSLPLAQVDRKRSIKRQSR